MSLPSPGSDGQHAQVVDYYGDTIYDGHDMTTSFRGSEAHFLEEGSCNVASTWPRQARGSQNALSEGNSELQQLKHHKSQSSINTDTMSVGEPSHMLVYQQTQQSTKSLDQQQQQQTQKYGSQAVNS